MTNLCNIILLFNLSTTAAFNGFIKVQVFYFSSRSQLSERIPFNYLVSQYYFLRCRSNRNAVNFWSLHQKQTKNHGFAIFTRKFVQQERKFCHYLYFWKHFVVYLFLSTDSATFLDLQETHSTLIKFAPISARKNEVSQIPSLWHKQWSVNACGWGQTRHRWRALAVPKTSSPQQLHSAWTRHWSSVMGCLWQAGMRNLNYRTLWCWKWLIEIIKIVGV